MLPRIVVGNGSPGRWRAVSEIMSDSIAAQFRLAMDLDRQGPKPHYLKWKQLCRLADDFEITEQVMNSMHLLNGWISCLVRWIRQVILVTPAWVYAYDITFQLCVILQNIDLSEISISTSEENVSAFLPLFSSKWSFEDRCTFQKTASETSATIDYLILCVMLGIKIPCSVWPSFMPGQFNE